MRGRLLAGLVVEGEGARYTVQTTAVLFVCWSVCLFGHWLAGSVVGWFVCVVCLFACLMFLSFSLSFVLSLMVCLLFACVSVSLYEW